MTHYYIEVKLGTKWILQKVLTRQNDALYWVKMNSPEFSQYPIRIIKVKRTEVFLDRNK